MESKEQTRYQATIVAPALVDSLFTNPPVEVFNAGVLEAGRSAWLFQSIEEPGRAARDLPVNELAFAVPPGHWLNSDEKPTRIERWT